MKNANQPATPVIDESSGNNYYGLTKREYFTAIAMQGFCSDSQSFITADFAKLISKQAVEVADALLKELDK